MGGIDDDELLTDHMNLRMKPSEGERLREEARVAGIGISELVRRRYFGYPIIAQADLAVVRELRRMGGLMKHLHQESGGAYSKEVASMSAEIVKAIRRIAAP